MTKAVTDLLATATALLVLGDNEALGGAIDSLKALGDDAKGTSQEYKDLKVIVEEIQSQNSSGNETNTDDQEVIDAERLSELKKLAVELKIEVSDESTIEELEKAVQAELDAVKAREDAEKAKNEGKKVSVKLNVRYADKMPGNTVKVSTKEAKRLIDNGFGQKA